MQRMTPNQVIRGTMAQYGIVWDAYQDTIVLHEAYGSHSFLSISKLWKFGFGEGCVGRAYASHKTIVLEDATTGANAFLRSGIAEQCGIRTIAFIPQENGSVLEVGFERKLEELPRSWWMSNLLDLCAQDSKGEWVSQTMQRLKTPSPEPLIEFPMFGGSPNESGGGMMLRPPSPVRGFPGMRGFQALVMVAARPMDSKPQIEVYNIEQEVETREPSVDEAGKSEDELPDAVPMQSTLSDPSMESEAESLGDAEAEVDAGGSVGPVGPVDDAQFSCSPCNTDIGLVQSDLAQYTPIPQGQMCIDPKMQVDDPFTPMKVNDPWNPMKIEVEVAPEPWTVPPYGTILPPEEVAALTHPWTWSAGSIGHPYSCGGACKYTKTKKGCKQGALCNRCHLCFWTRASERALNSFKELSSAGSVGHPHSCGGPCKFHTQKKCKEGASCSRCHLCHWTRAGERALDQCK